MNTEKQKKIEVELHDLLNDTADKIKSLNKLQREIVQRVKEKNNVEKRES